MKIKTDFVTNSSSSSFVVIGINAEVDSIPLSIFQDIKMKVKVTAEDLQDDPYEYFSAALKNSDLTWAIGCEYEGSVMIGIPYTSMEDDETLSQFKQRVEDQLKEFLMLDVTPGHIEECWMDN